ncbi:DEAD/DEAH box helicase family protein [Thiocapsa sp. UBA6158]|jgi:type I restriction enzyme R subunit|uniref:DEAD/DEAH box helicase family protein n=1 Tax=Thiocapsa sp. UBA6158 TaxID=1947692 RepID=UPI0025D8CD57|nr:DEAD/DEAH box helicase family protein [Thiocapsa sp. UBA6158]
MTRIGQSERETQDRVIALFRDALGYRHLGDWTDRAGNSNIEEGLLSTWLTHRGYSEAQIAMALYRLRTEADDSRFKLDKYLLKLCEKPRLIELMRDFVLFDGGIKKLPRTHQYFGVKAAQSHVRRRQGGIIWHTQGSGKSIVMVLLARWILETFPDARVVVITDRDELDSQIEGVFGQVGESIYRTNSGRDLMAQLGRAKPRLLCSLVHKFGRRDVDDVDAFIKELEGQPSRTVGEVFVFVDECHRTQSGKLHRVMKALMPNAVFIGFTGTPLLKKDKATSLEVFGGYIHTYKFSEAVEDQVALDLVYEARDIDQRLGSKEKIDAWFASKTKGLNTWQKEELKSRWVTMQSVLSSRSRMDRVVNDIVFDFSVKQRLSSQRGNAMLVASSIYEACKYFMLFQNTPLKGKCAVVTSYNPQAKDVTKEEVGANTETDKQLISCGAHPKTRSPRSAPTPRPTSSSSTRSTKTC